LKTTLTGNKNTSQKSRLIIIFIIFLLLLTIIILYESKHRRKNEFKDELILPDDNESLVDYFLDSTYKVVADTLIKIYKVKTGENISTLSMFYEPIHSMAMHPSGNFLAVLGEYYLDVYDLKRDNLSNTDTALFIPDDKTTLDVMDMDYLEFSADGKYLMVFDYGNVEVEIYKWPGLKYLDTGYLGFRRNNFRWESSAGKLVFYYYEDRYIYRTEFPSDKLSGSLTFSEPVLIDSVPDNE
jgi:hypothetical protein